jgi:cell wall-associated NlpC family hydrolase
VSGGGAAIAARARALVGTRFRPQGRQPALGLDCVGLAAAAAGVPAERLPGDYALRGQKLARIEQELCDLGCVPVPGGAAEPGDVVVCDAGPAQFHLAVATGEGFVHADAGLRRVIERPLPLPWPALSVWRMAGGE